MKRLLLAAVLAGAAHTSCAHELTAQSRQPIWGLTPIARDQVVRGELTSRNLNTVQVYDYGGKYIKEFFYQARAGETPTLSVRAEFPGEWQLTSFLSMAEGMLRCDGQAPTPAGMYGSCSTKKPLSEDAEIYIMLVGTGPGAFTLTMHGSADGAGLYASDLSASGSSRKVRSNTSGMHLSAGYGTVNFVGEQSTVEGGSWEDAGVGPSGRVGLGFGPFSLFAEGQMSRMATAGEEYTESNGYTLYHADLGSRLYFLGSGSWLRPYVQFAYGMRRMAAQVEEGDAEMEGVTLTPGAGMQLFLTPTLSVEGTYRRTTGDYTRIRRVGEEWIDVPEDLYLTGLSNRISAQMVVHF